jgi:proteic killer suppression protein
MRYYRAVIRSFRDKDTERLFARDPVKRWGPDVQRAGLRKLRMLDAATRAEDLRVPPGNRLEKLGGNRAGQWSIRVNDQWRLCFAWKNGDAHDVEMVDSH